MQQQIFTIRNHKVMLDYQLAELYGVSTKQLNQAVKRNIERFPLDFMFQLTSEELRDMWSQTVTTYEVSDRKFVRSDACPCAFTEKAPTQFIYTE